MDEWLGAASVGQALHLRAGWSLILCGFVSGAALGAGFLREGFLGGYASARRRLLRLAHVALVALGALNVLYALMPLAAERALAGPALLAGAVAMPAACALVAWRPSLRPLLALPVAALLAAASAVLCRIF